MPSLKLLMKEPTTSPLPRISRSWSPQLIKACQDSTQIQFLTEEETLSRISRDFGALLKGRGIAVVYPSSSQEILKLLKFANQHRLILTVRGKGYSQGGQSLPPKGGITLDCSKMDQVYAPDLEALSIKCQSGATWRAVTAATFLHGLVPKVIPFFSDLTVGGVLSIGGIGGNSHLYGCVSGNVENLEVITGLGEHKECSISKERELFEAVLCGLGQYGVITSATLSLRRYKKQVKTFYLLYDNYETWIFDQENLAKKKACDYLEAFCTISLQGLRKIANAWRPFPFWLYSTQVSFEYEEGGADDFSEILASLNFWRLLHIEDSQTVDFLTRYGVRVDNMRRSGNWELYHPWFDCFLSPATLAKVLPEILERLPLSLGDGLGYRIFCVNDACPPFFMRPTSTLTMGFAALPVGVDANSLKEALAALEYINKRLLSLGGKRYLSGWLGHRTPNAWQSHYAPFHEKLRGLKEKYDPNKLLHSIALEMAE